MRSFCFPEIPENAGDFQKLKLEFLVKIWKNTLDEANVRVQVVLFMYLKDIRSLSNGSLAINYFEQT